MHAGRTRSIWMDTAHRPAFDALARDAACDVCVIGAGIAGLTTAYLLAREGKDVVVLDDGPIVSGETERTTAHLTYALDDRYKHLAVLHGSGHAQLAAQSHKEAIRVIEEIVQREEIPCDFERVPGYLFLTPGEKKEILETELLACHHADLGEVTPLDRIPLLPFDSGPCLLFPHQAQFHPLRYLNALAKRTGEAGGRIFTHTHVTTVKSDALSATATTENGHHVRSRDIVIATNAPIHDSYHIYTKQSAYRTYVIGMRIPRHYLPPALYWDTGAESRGHQPVPYHYVRTQHMDDHDVLIVGGEDHKTGQAQDMRRRFTALEEWTRHRFPEAGKTLYAWSGQVMEPSDGLAMIGRHPTEKERLFVATGDSGNGMTHGTIAGILLSDLITGKTNPWEKIYDPSRITLRALPGLIRENLNVAREMTDWLTPGEVSSVAQIPLESGRIIRHGLTKIAVYRDAQGKEHALSAVCPHRGCLVSWNDWEKTWDCPCHGSRFLATGEAVNGPSADHLAPAHLPEQEKAEMPQKTGKKTSS